MAVDARSMRGRPRDLVTVVVRRKRAVRREQVDAILSRRARGFKPERIAQELRMDLARVEGVISDERQAGDPRALTEQQAAAAMAREAQRWGSKSTPAAPVPAMPSTPPAPARQGRVIRASTFGPGEEVARASYVAMLLDASERLFPSHPHAGPTFGHLADLFLHCPTAYPTFVLRDGGGMATLESTDRQFPRHAVTRSLTSSHAELCAAG